MIMSDKKPTIRKPDEAQPKQPVDDMAAYFAY